MGRYDDKGGKHISLTDAKTRYSHKYKNQLGQRIKSELYDVYVPRLATLTEFEMEHMPRDNSFKRRGGKSIDYMNMLIHVRLPIITLAEYHDSGYSIKLVNGADIVSLYETLEEYLDMKGNALKYSPNGLTLDTKDLVLLDKLAESILDLNRDNTLVEQTAPLMLAPKKSKLINRTTDIKLVPKRRIEGSTIIPTLTSARYLGRK